jgi:hypothetical protein
MPWQMRLGVREDDLMEEIRRVADDYVLRRLCAEDLPMAAAQALTRGVDSPALRELAGLGRADVRDAVDLLGKAMAELGHPVRSPGAILRERAQLAAVRLLAGELAAPEAAGQIAALLCEADHLDERDSSSELATRFEVLSADWDDYPADQRAIADDIKAVARQLLDERVFDQGFQVG